jgi:lipopolysaccharide biosynthesis glycosyltransferase
MSEDKKVIPIFFSVDDGYIPFLAVTIQSLVENSSKEYNYVIKILYTNIKEDKKRKIKKYERDNISIEFVDLNYYIKKVKDKFYTRDYYTNTTYFRLFIPDLYPQYNKALYLDCDIVILNDVAKLYEIEIENNLIAGVPDDVIQTIEVFRDYAEKVVGLLDYKNYFNAGILVMNLHELRKFNLKEKFIYLLENIKFSVAQDQDYLNRLCKGRVKIIDSAWNVMPINPNKNGNEINIIHYNLDYKPWHFEDVPYGNYFWKYASKTEYYKRIKQIRYEYTDEQRTEDKKKTQQLIELAKKEADCVGDDRLRKQENEIIKDKTRIEILEKIKKYEREGKFDLDVEDDPPTIPLEPDKIDYLKTKTKSKLKNKFANKMGEKYLDDLLKEQKLIIKEIKGIKYLKNLNEGTIITCNHFNPMDVFAIEQTFRVAGKRKNNKLYKVIREGNYTNFPGFYGFLFRNADTLPLSSNLSTMHKFMSAVKTILNNGDYILIYPEQSMWWNYEKPKPLKNGAYRFATKNMVPILPIFITFCDSDKTGEDGFKIKEYTINIAEPIYPIEGLNEKENMKMMREKNAEVWKKIYEEYYKIPLKYDTRVDIG